MFRPIRRRVFQPNFNEVLPQLQPATPGVNPPPAPRIAPRPATTTQPLAGLTPSTSPALPLAQAQARAREDECVCEETEEEKEERRESTRSNVVAKVKAFARRMSQSSLDNLRRG
jgi:hypothetical protein